MYFVCFLARLLTPTPKIPGFAVAELSQSGFGPSASGTVSKAYATTDCRFCLSVLYKRIICLKASYRSRSLRHFRDGVVQNDTKIPELWRGHFGENQVAKTKRRPANLVRRAPLVVDLRGKPWTYAALPTENTALNVAARI